MSFVDENEVPMLVSILPYPADLAEELAIDFDNEHQPRELTENFTIEHQIFVAYLKQHLDEEEIAHRLLALFPHVVEVREGNAHGKLMAKWMAIGQWVGMMASRWAPVQDPCVDFLLEYEWGRKLVEEFEVGNRGLVW